MLYIVSTPIGNLEDITLRALRVLKESDYVLAEDTRRTFKLFSHYKIPIKIKPYHDFNRNKVMPGIIADLKAGMEISIVTDSGTPCISDPGSHLVKEAALNGIKISPIPGPSSPIAALSCSGLNGDRFEFLGFLPKAAKKKERSLWR